jgi:hypothetical protein
MAFEFQVPDTISVCADCVHFNAFGRLDDEAVRQYPHATELHKAMIAAKWPWGTGFTAGCGRDCPEHGVAAYETEEAYEESKDGDVPEPWFSWSACEQCGSELGGNRKHATAWEYLSPAEVAIRAMPDNDLSTAITYAAGQSTPKRLSWLNPLLKERAYRDSIRKEQE